MLSYNPCLRPPFPVEPQEEQLLDSGATTQPGHVQSQVSIASIHSDLCWEEVKPWCGGSGWVWALLGENYKPFSLGTDSLSAFGVLSWCAGLQFLQANSSSGTAAVLTHRGIFKEGLRKGPCLCFHPVGAGHQIHLWGKCMENIYQNQRVLSIFPASFSHARISFSFSPYFTLFSSLPVIGQ